MGVDYYQCDSCDRGYRDDSDYACFCECGGRFCSDTCGELENFTYEYDEEADKGNAVDPGRPITCILCRLQKATDFGLLAALLKYYGITRDEAFEIYKKQQADHD